MVVSRFCASGSKRICLAGRTIPLIGEPIPLLVGDGDAMITFGDGTYITPKWDFLPPSGSGAGVGGPGVYYTSVPLKHFTTVEVDITRESSTIINIVGNISISASNCINGLTNWTAWVTFYPGVGTIPPVLSTFILAEQTCVAGYSVPGNFDNLCKFTCSLGYVRFLLCLLFQIVSILQVVTNTNTTNL